MSSFVLYPVNENVVGLHPDLNLDIIAIHGLNGDRFRTWTEPKSKKLWLRDFLPKDLPRGRILTFGYNATAAFENSVADIVDHGRELLGSLVERREEKDESKRPLMFVGHSLGGLVVKQALIIAEREARYRNIYDSTIGVIFFGTPHRGSNLANYAATLARIPIMLANKPNAELLESLKRGNDKLKLLTDDFRRLLEGRHLDIVSFYETRSITGMNNVVVEKASALLTPPGEVATYEEQIPVDADHRDICRFSSPKNTTYKTAVSRIKRVLLDRYLVQVKHEYYVVPGTVNLYFTGRNDIRQQLSDCLAACGNVPSKPRPVFVLYGLGGSGKTQICLKFVEDHRERFWGIFWIDANSYETAQESFLNIARATQQDENADSVRAWLSGQDHWLLIFDNADDPGMDILKFFPSGNRGTILITSRNPDLRQYGSAGSYRVHEMSTESSITLLLKTATVNIEDSAMRVSAGRVVEALGYLALAIIQAGAVIRQGICSLDGFCDLYAEEKQLLEIGRPTSSMGYQYSVYTTWEIPVRKIQEMTDVHAQLSIELLRLFSFMHFDGINLDIFKRARTNLDLPTDDFLTGSTFSVTKLAKFMESGWDEVLIRKSLKLLAGFSLISMDGSDRISMHPLVHEWSRERMSELERTNGWRIAVSTLAMSLCWRYDLKHKQYRRYLLPHIEACLSGAKGQLFAPHPDLQEYASMAERFSSSFGANGRIQEALDLEREVLKWRQVAHSPNSKIVLRAMTQLAIIYNQFGRHQEAIELQENALNLFKTLQGSDEDSLWATLFLMRNNALSHLQLGHLHAGMDKIMEAFQTSKTTTGEHSLHTNMALDLVSFAHSLRGEWTDAARTGEIVLKEFRTDFKSQASATMIRMANLYRELEDFEKSRALFTECVALLEDSLGENSQEAALARAQMVSANAGERIWRKKSGILLREGAVRKLEVVFGKNDPRTLLCMGYLAQSYIMCGALKKAQELDEQRVTGLSGTLGERSPWTVAAKRDLTSTRQMIAIRKAFYWWVPKRFLP